MRFLRASWAPVLALMVVLGMPGRGAAQGTLTTLFTNGPVSNRINIVVLSEAYRTNDLPQFPTDAANVVGALLAAPPYSAYSNYFNAYAISVASAQNFSDHPNAADFRNTYFNSSYDTAANKVITIPPNQFDANYNNGKGKVRSLLTNLMPQYDLVILLVNDGQYGGSGEPPDIASNLALTITSKHFAYPELVRHEAGHAFAGLADEYALSGLEGVTLKERPNATRSNTLPSIRWNSWISNSVPIPTPDDPTNDTVVGLFLGAQYTTNGWYRPKRDCKMRSFDLSGAVAAYCEVCSEAIVKAIYLNNLTLKKLRLIEAVAPASPNITLAAADGFAFSVTNLQPATHALSVQWFTNNTAVGGATNPVFTLVPGNYPNGNLNLRAVVRDPTLLVRNDPANLLSNSVAWTVNIAQSSLTLVNPRWLNPNQFAFAVTGTAPLGFNVQGSTNLSGWTNLTSSSLSGGVFHYTNSGIGNFNPRFYRAVVTNTP